MKKYILLASLFVFFLFLPLVNVDAMSMMPPPYPGQTPGSIFGQDHAYTVTFRGNGEAAVNMKSVFTNQQEATLSALMFQIPRGEVENVTAYQVIREPQCIRYDNSIYETMASNQQTQEPLCLDYQQPDYYSYYYGQSRYVKADVAVAGDTISVMLPEPVSPQTSASIMMYYRASGYATKNAFGAYQYTFETLKTDDTIRNVNVGITTDTGLKLKDAKTEVQYDRTMMATPAMDSMESSKMAMGGVRFDQYYQNIGYGTISENATELQPFDTFTVTGSYGKGWFNLYGKEVLIGVLIIIGIVLFMIALVRRLWKSWKNKKAMATNKPQPTTTGHNTGHSVILMIGSSFAATVIAAIFTLIVFFVMTRMSSMYNIYPYDMLIGIFFLLISFVVYATVIFGPAVLIGMKRGVWWGVGTLGCTIAGLAFCLIVVLFFLFFMGTNRHYPYPTTYMQGASEGMRIQ